MDCGLERTIEVHQGKSPFSGVALTRSTAHPQVGARYSSVESNGHVSCAAYGTGGEQGKDTVKAKTGPSEAMLVLEHALAAVLEASREVAQLVAKLKRVKRG